MKQINFFLCTMLLLVINLGCSVDNTDSGASQDVVNQATGQNTANPPPAAEPPPAPAPEPTPAPPISTDGRDQLNIAGAILLGPHAGVPIKSAAITRNLYAASIEGGLVNFSVDRLGWPVPGTPVAGVDARTYIFWVEGSQVYGGHFDWQRPGQTSKTLENIKDGYLGRRPPSGAPVWFALCRIDGRERTNVAISQNPW
jgi:hypothetical protein